MTSPQRAYFVDGVELVNCGEDRCSACDRPAVGYSIAGHLICATHAGMAATLAEEYAQELEASRKRTDGERTATLERVRRAIAPTDASVQVGTMHLHRRGRPKARVPKFKCGHPQTTENVYTHPAKGWKVCRTCSRDRVRRRRAAS